ncbi:MAG: GMP synthase (glutamine-hydrolyzing), partial [Lachnospiraceae bacterium]|nr:GMP synthase (glutamine-hydrolyzing) [Lachnospiraceae bacterium]
MQNQKVQILNFGGQYDQLIARRVRECKVYCEVRPYTMTLAEIQEFAPIGIIFTGGPDSVYKEDSLHPADGIFTMGIPILGICYGCQLLAHHLGGAVVEAGEGNAREYGKT